MDAAATGLSSNSANTSSSFADKALSTCLRAILGEKGGSLSCNSERPSAKSGPIKSALVDSA